MSQPRREFLKAIGLGGLGLSVSGDGEKDEESELLDYVDWEHGRFSPASVFIDGRRIYFVTQASETSGWVRYIARLGRSPYDPLCNNFMMANRYELLKRQIRGRVEIRFDDKDTRQILLREQNECLNG